MCTGPTVTDVEVDMVIDCVGCSACWRKNPKNLADLCDVIKLSAKDIAALMKETQ